MGAWGPAIFSDDTAADIRGDYRELLEDQVPDAEATQRVIESYQHLDADEEHILWLALSAAQAQVGRLDDAVRDRALEIIDTERGLELWKEAGPKELAKRKAALAKLRAQLTGPQPERKTIRRPWRHETDLRPGTVLAFTAANGQLALLRVAKVDDQRVGAAPILEWLDWSGRSVPRPWRLRRLSPRLGDLPLPGRKELRRPQTFRVGRYKKKSPDWPDVGFTQVAQLPARPGDSEAQAWSYLDWSALSKKLERQLTT